MMTILATRILGLALVTPSAALLPSQRAHALAPTELAALHARFDPSLGSLRAGLVDVPASFGPCERAELTAAEERDTSLAALRAGSEPTNDQWTWIAIGAAIVLLIILL